MINFCYTQVVTLSFIPTFHPHVFQAEYHIRGRKSFDSIFRDMPGCSMHRRCSAYGYSCNFSNISPCFFSWTSQSYWWMPHFRQSSSEVSFCYPTSFYICRGWLGHVISISQIYMNLANMGGSTVFCIAVVVFILPNKGLCCTSMYWFSWNI